MNNNHVQRQRERYRTNFLEFGATPQGLFWNNRETQYLRFERLVNNLLSKDDCFTIHDVGAGVCDLHRYLLERGVKHTYSGTEIVQEMVSQSHTVYPDVRLYNRDFLEAPLDEKYDYVVLSGVFNLATGEDALEQHEHVHRLLLHMFALADKAIAFNFLSTYKTLTADSLHYFDPKDLFDFCMTRLSRFVILDHAYPLYEGTICVFKEKDIAGRYDKRIYGKYFRQ
jgi:hypothetical protein